MGSFSWTVRRLRFVWSISLTSCLGLCVLHRRKAIAALWWLRLTYALCPVQWEGCGAMRSVFCQVGWLLLLPALFPGQRYGLWVLCPGQREGYGCFGLCVLAIREAAVGWSRLFVLAIGEAIVVVGPVFRPVWSFGWSRLCVLDRGKAAIWALCPAHREDCDCYGFLSWSVGMLGCLWALCCQWDGQDCSSFQSDFSA